MRMWPCGCYRRARAERTLFPRAEVIVSLFRSPLCSVRLRDSLWLSLPLGRWSMLRFKAVACAARFYPVPRPPHPQPPSY